MNKGTLERITEALLLLLVVAALGAIIGVWFNDNQRQNLRWAKVAEERKAQKEERKALYEARMSAAMIRVEGSAE